MKKIHDANALHKQAAEDHQAAAEHHQKAAQCHAENLLTDAKASAKMAMECCNTAQKNTQAACDCSAK